MWAATVRAQVRQHLRSDHWVAEAEAVAPRALPEVWERANLWERHVLLHLLCYWQPNHRHERDLADWWLPDTHRQQARDWLLAEAQALAVRPVTGGYRKANLHRIRRRLDLLDQL